MNSDEYSKKLEERDLRELREQLQKNPGFSLVDLSAIDEDESLTIKNLSDQAFRLLINMVLQAHAEANGIATVGANWRHPRHYESAAALNELKGAGLITNTQNPDTGKEYPHNYAVLPWFEMTGEE